MPNPNGNSNGNDKREYKPEVEYEYLDADVWYELDEEGNPKDVAYTEDVKNRILPEEEEKSSDGNGNAKN